LFITFTFAARASGRTTPFSSLIMSKKLVMLLGIEL
jgi:hypothetical protein